MLWRSEGQQKLAALEEAAKAAGKGKWGPPEELALHIRDTKWNIDNPRHFVESHKNKEIEGEDRNIICFVAVGSIWCCHV